jgi:hypothetical protein
MPAAVAIPSAISAGTSILGGIVSGSASKKAAATQTQNAQKVADMALGAAGDAKKYEGEALTNANTRLDDSYHAQTANLDPYLAAGTQGVNSLAAGMAAGGDLTKQFSFNPDDFKNDPSFKFLMDQGNQAIQRSAAATGSLGTGGTLKSLTQFAQGTADTKFGEAYNRALGTFQTNRNNTLQGLNMLIGAGQTATGQFDQASQNWGNTSAANTMRAGEYEGNAGMEGARIAGDALTGGANAAAAGTVGQANAWSQALGGVSNAAQFAGMSNMLRTPTGVQGMPANSSSTSVAGMIPMNPRSYIAPPPPAVAAPPNIPTGGLPGGYY